MSDKPNNHNWLRAQIIECPQCQEQLYRVDHSPLCDDYHLYCDSCSNSVEVGYYDPVHVAISDELSEQGRVEYQVLMAEIEKRLKPCSCGGHFRHDAPRRCHYCLAEVVTNESGVDLWPAYYDVDADDDKLIERLSPTVAEFEREHIRRHHIWKDE